MYRGRIRIATIALVTTALLLPARAARLSLPKTEKWIEVRTGNFEILGNAGAGTVRKIGVDLERFREVLSMVTQGFDFSSDAPTSVYVFKRDRDLEPYKLDDSGKPRELAGYFMERPFRKYIAIDASAGGTPRRTIYHEYVHSLLHQTFESLPLWLDEGLAEYYSTFEYVDSTRRAEIGHPVPGHLRYLARNRLLPLEELFETTHRSRNYNEGSRAGVFYAQSWMLVHYMVSDEERHKRFGTFLTALRDGADAQEALLSALELDLETLGKRLRDYIRQGSTYYWLTLKEDTGSAPSEARPMAPGQVLRRLGELLAQRGPAHTAAANEHLQAALQFEGPKDGIYEALGLAAEIAGDAEQAESWYRRALAADGKNATYATRLAGLLLDRYFDTNPVIIGGQRTPQPVEEARELFRLSLELEPAGIEAMAGMGRTFLFGGDSEVGLRLLASAATQRPFRTDVLHDLAALLALDGRREAAWAVIERQLEPTAREPEIVVAAQDWVVTAEIDAANQRVVDGDRDGAFALLDAAARRVDDGRLKDRIERARKRIESPGIAFEGSSYDADSVDAHNRLVGIYNEAGRLANAGRLEEAAKLIEETLPSCNVPDLCDSMRETLRSMRANLDANRLIALYNEAIDLLNDGKRRPGIEILQEIYPNVRDAEFKNQVRTMLRALGVDVEGDDAIDEE